ncbi:MAG: ribonuclease E/G [Lachnospiraceae bacterium]
MNKLDNKLENELENKRSHRNKRIIVKRKNQYVSAWWQDGEIVQLDVDSMEEKNLSLGDIYVARVKDIVHNIQAAFLDLGDGKMAYYSLKEGGTPILCHCAREGALNVGDSLVVQVTKEAVKTKFAVAEGKLNLTGRYMVLINEPMGICFSGKIKDTVWKKQIQRDLQTYLFSHGIWGERPSFGFIIRTNAYEVNLEAIFQDLEQLSRQYQKICQTAPYRKVGTCLKKSSRDYLISIRDSAKNLDEIVTDDAEIYEEISNFMQENNMPNFSVRLYEDKLLPLEKLYSLEKWIEQALREYVWLKSGAYLVFQPTEALTVVDVNTGKITGNRDMEETFLKVNLEAVREIARQIRLRNYSGIILIDFINMKKVEHSQLLMEQLTAAVESDPVKTAVVDMTKLGLVEITRQKKRAPLHEVIVK